MWIVLGLLGLVIGGIFFAAFVFDNAIAPKIVPTDEKLRKTKRKLDRANRLYPDD